MDKIAVAEAFGWIGGTVGAASAWPQVWRLWIGRQHKGVSVMANVLAVFYGVGWTTYGLWQRSLSMTITNLLATLAVAAVLAGVVIMGQVPFRAWVPQLLAAFAVLAVVAAVGGHLAVGSLVGAATSASMAAQVVALIRQRRKGDYDVRGLSLPHWWLMNFCSFMWVDFGILHGDVVVGLTAGVNLVLGLAVVGLAVLPQRTVAQSA